MFLLFLILGRCVRGDLPKSSESEISSVSPMWMAGTQVLGKSPVAFPGALARCWIGSGGGRTWTRHYKVFMAKIWSPVAFPLPSSKVSFDSGLHFLPVYFLCIYMYMCWLTHWPYQPCYINECGVTFCHLFFSYFTASWKILFCCSFLCCVGFDRISVL